MAHALLDHPTLNSRYFFPRPGAQHQAFVVQAHGHALRCHRSTPHPGARTVVYFHGNGETVSDYVPWLTDRFAALGLNTFLAEYRGYGGSDGTPSLGAMLTDVGPIVEAVGAPPSELFAFGRSVGSLFALEMVARYPATRGLVLESAIAAPLERLLLRVRPEELGATEASLAAEVARWLDHREKISGYAGPVLVLHALHDDLVLPTHGKNLAAWATRARDVRLRLLPAGDHNSIQTANLEAYWEELHSFLAAAGD